MSGIYNSTILVSFVGYRDAEFAKLSLLSPSGRYCWWCWADLSSILWQRWLVWLSLLTTLILAVIPLASGEITNANQVKTSNKDIWSQNILHRRRDSVAERRSTIICCFQILSYYVKNSLGHIPGFRRPFFGHSLWRGSEVKPAYQKGLIELFDSLKRSRIKNQNWCTVSLWTRITDTVSYSCSSVSTNLSSTAAMLWKDILAIKLSALPDVQAAFLNRALGKNFLHGTDCASIEKAWPSTCNVFLSVLMFGCIGIGFAFMAATMQGPITQVRLHLQEARMILDLTD